MSTSVNPARRTELKQEMAAELLRSCGTARLPVNGSSMLPALWPGDVLEVRRRPLTEIEPGQVVVFQRRGRLVVHRVIRHMRQDSDTLLITRGDRRWRCDAPVATNELLGHVKAVHRANRQFAPRLTLWSRIGSLLCQSEIYARVVGRLMRRRQQKQASAS
jgi:signal peptidase I